MSEALTVPTMEKYTLVSIAGLQSAEGKKLNGGLGILLKDTSSLQANDEGVVRLPIRIFALQDRTTKAYNFQLEQLPLDKGLKAANVQKVKATNDKAKDCLRQAVHYIEDRAIQLDPSHDSKMTFWYAARYKALPSLLNGMSYATLLKDSGKFADACQICSTTVDQFNVMDEQPSNRCATFCNLAAKTLCTSKEYLGKALEYALKTPQNSPPNQSLRKEALTEVINACKQILIRSRNIGVDDIAQWNLQGAKALLQLDTNDLIFNEALAAAYCLAGNNWEGVKWYRRALMLAKMKGGVGTINQASVQSSLILAQLQCPGMPLEDYHLLNSQGNILTLVEKKDLDKVSVVTLPGDRIGVDTKENVAMIQYEAPLDPNDLEVFSDLLKKLKTEGGQPEFKAK